MIILGVYLFGMCLFGECEFVERFEVSCVVVCEVEIFLEVLGYVEIKVGLGVYVCEFQVVNYGYLL